MIDKLTLHDIANWQLETEHSIVELPSVQRGFVWKPKQIEDLWDSLFRGYPIGSFLFSKTGKKLYLMDGQQRATSIFLGYFNPFDYHDETKAWSIKGELPVVWIDIKPQNKPENSRYLVRLTTQSHPWGYQANFNDRKLSVSDRRNALNLFRLHQDNIKGYTSFKNSTVFPYDCCYPLPISFLIESKNVDEVIERVETYLPDYISTKHGNFNNKKDFITLLNSELHQELLDIFETVKSIDKVNIKSNIIENNVLNEENDTENPTLFVRINSAGTTLTGDNLIYSIYKSIFPTAQTLIENIGVNFITPTQVLSLTTRIVASNLEGDKYIKKINVRDFQRRIKDDDFKVKLSTIIESKQIEQLFDDAISILSCKHNSLFDGEIPPVIVKQFIKKNQELFLFFIYWLYLHNVNLDDKTKLKITAKLFSFAWFDFGNYKRLWNEKISNDNFWNEPLNELIWWDGKDGIHFLIPPNLLRDYYAQDQIEKLFVESNEHKWGLWKEGVGTEIKQYYSQVKSQEFELETANEYF